MTNAHMANMKVSSAAKKRQRRFWEAAEFFFMTAFLLTVALTLLEFSLSQ